MAGHTPGPWRLDHERTIVDAHGTKIAETWPPHPDALPDARLIAAAPDLLDALKAAVLRVELANAEGDPILSAWLPDAWAAIAKAEKGA